MSDRYRLPAVPFLMLFAVYGAGTLVSRIAEKRWMPAAAAVLLLGAGLVLTRWPVTAEPPNVSSYFNLATIYERAGLSRRAVAAYGKAVLINAVLKSDAVVTGECRAVSGAGGQALADFMISDVLKGQVAASSIRLPSLPALDSPQSGGGKGRPPRFRPGDEALLFLKKGDGGAFSVLGGAYGRYPLVKDGRDGRLVSLYLPLSSLQSSLPDARPVIPLAVFKAIVEEILKTGDFMDDPRYFDASISEDNLASLREARRKDARGRRERDFWQ
jgi:hypothetical protein